MTYNWQERWVRNEIAFHLESVNPLLEKYWPQLAIAKNTNVLVPLCGKTLDLLWLANRGHHVIGIELSDIACEAFFTENNLGFKKKVTTEFTLYFNDKIKLYCGDFFSLTKEMISPITAVYDRAALVALPKETRQRYAHHLVSLLDQQGEIMLISYDSPDMIQGPPFSVPFSEIKSIYGSGFQIEELVSIKKDIPSHLSEKGYKELHENVYRLKKNS